MPPAPRAPGGWGETQIDALRHILWVKAKVARKASQADLGQSIAPSSEEELPSRARRNGDGHAPVSDIGPQVAEPRLASSFPPIAEYAFLSDCEVNCLIAPSGRVEWMCLPRPDSPSVFAAMLDRGAGSFAFGPTGVLVPAGRRYLPGTLVLEPTWGTKTLRQGDRAYVAMVWPRSRHSTGKEYWAEHPAPATIEEAFERVEKTAEFWREWINRGDFPEHPWQSYLQRSALTLKGLTYSPTGALLAAPTTSLPETIGGERNWDYRYTWIRDGTFMLWGLYTLGFARGRTTSSTSSRTSRPARKTSRSCTASAANTS